MGGRDDGLVTAGGNASHVNQQPQKNGIATAGLVCAFFIPLLGWIFGGIGLSRSKQRGGVGYHASSAAILIATVVFAITLVVRYAGL